MNLIVVAERSCKLFKKRNRLDIREFAFSNGIVDTWDALSLIFNFIFILAFTGIVLIARQ